MDNRFSRGRNGADELSVTLVVTGVISFLAYPAFDNQIAQAAFIFLAAVLTGTGIWRSLSRNTGKRRHENQVFVDFFKDEGKEERERKKAEEKAKREKRKEEEKTYAFYRCSGCKQELRVPRGKGKIRIKCPACGEQFIKKT